MDYEEDIEKKENIMKSADEARENETFDTSDKPKNEQKENDALTLSNKREVVRWYEKLLKEKEEKENAGKDNKEEVEAEERE